MSTSFRAAIAVVLLAGFPLLVLAVIGGLVTFEIVALQHSVVTGLKLAILMVPLIWVLLKGLFMIERHRAEPQPGVPITPEQQPELWTFLRRLAEQAQAPVPDELYLNSEVNAGVHEETRLLGLQAVRRRMVIGAPLLAALTTQQLAAVVAHELAHYSNQDTRFGAITYRGQKTIARVQTQLVGKKLFRRLLRWIFSHYAKLYFLVAKDVCRRQELAADKTAAQSVGSKTTIEALREIPVIEASWQLFIDNYATAGWEYGYLPESFFDGFEQLRAGVGDVLIGLRENPPSIPLSRYDSHPPLATRITALKASPLNVTENAEPELAVALLHEANEVLDSALLNDFSDKAQTMQRLSWPDLIDLSARKDTEKSVVALVKEAGIIMSGKENLESVLDVLTVGKIADLAAISIPTDVGPRARRELAREPVRKELSKLVILALADAGVARWELSWSAMPMAVLDSPYAANLGTALDAAVSDEFDTSPLRQLLDSAGVDQLYQPEHISLV